nr:TonB-dependent receptor [uncultured Brevundimonas sp.]
MRGSCFAGAFLTAMGILTAPVVANAQTAPAPPTPSNPPVQPAPEQAATTLDEIVVTAQRREERLSEVPISITAYSAETLEKTGVVDSRGLTQITPGLNFQSVGSSAQPVIRGIGSSGASVGDSSNVATYVDGVYQPFQAANFLNFVDLERIEVLKGPQGTLFGRNAAGGAINIVTLNPSFDFGGRLGASYASFGDKQLSAYVEGPITDNLAFNISADYRDSDGFRRDIYLNEDLGYMESRSLRGKLLWNASDTVSVLATAYISRADDLTTFGNQPLDGNTTARRLRPDVLVPTEPNTSALSVIPANEINTAGANLKLTVDLGWATLTSLTAYAENRQFVNTDSDLTPASYSQSQIWFRDDMASQDFILASNSDGPLNWIIGASYYREFGEYHIRSYGGLLDFAVNPPLTYGLDITEVSIDAIAAFGEVTYELTDRLTVIGGVRFSQDTPSFQGTTLNVATNTPGPLASNSETFDSVTARASIRYALTPSINTYFSFSQGFKAGVFNVNSFQLTPVEPETVNAYEIGIKGALNSALSFDAAAYFYDYSDQQFSAFGTSALNPLLQNAAQSEIKGFEANAILRPLDGLTVRAGFAYTDGEYTDFPGAQGFRKTTDANGVPIGGNTSFNFDASGRPMVRTPKIQGNLTVSYERPLANGGLVAGDISGSYTGRIYHDLAGNFEQEPYQIWNAKVAYTTPDERWRATLYGTNIFDAEPIGGILVSALATSVTFHKPATVGFRLEYMF